VLDANDLSVKQVDQTGTAGGQQTAAHLTYGGGRVKGSATVPQQSGTPQSLAIDTTLAPGTYDDNALNVIVPALRLEPGKSFAVNVFSSTDGSARVFTVNVGAKESVTVPGGEFQAFKVEVSGGEAPFILYVSGDAPRRIVKLEIVGAPIVFELAK